jgi:hypothetical protein
MEFEYGEHAMEQMQIRHLSRARVDAVLHTPEQIVAADNGCVAYQSKFTTLAGKEMLLRVIVDERCRPAKVVSVYPTDKVREYWRP